MAEQGFLFSAAVDHKQATLSALEQLDISRAKAELQLASEIDPYIADIATLRNVIEYLSNYVNNTKTLVDGIVQAWHNIENAVEESVLSLPTARVTQELLAKAALHKVGNAPNGFIDQQSEQLHVGCCYLTLGNYKLAHKILLDSLTSTHQYRSDLWGYLGEVCYKLGRWQEANLAYSCALIIDPQRIDLFRLINPELEESYRELLIDYSETDARALLFTYCWLENILSIPIGNSRLARFSVEMESKLKEQLPNDTTDRYHRFAIYLCIDQSQLHGAVNIQAREQMIEIAPELFKRYMAKLRENSR